MLRITKQLLTMLRKHFPGLIAVRLVLVTSLLAFSASGWTGAIQYNIGNSIGRQGEQDITKLVVHQGKRPLVITLNEVCGKRYWEIAVALHSFGYRGYFDATNPNGCGGSNGGLGYGNAIFYLGEGIQAFVGRYVNNDSHNRRAVCVKAQLAQFAYLACATHLDDDDSRLAGKQALEFFHWVNQRRRETGNLPTIVGGDFNLTPKQFPMDLWYAYYKEVDGSRARATHSRGKIDYIFYSSGFIHQKAAEVKDLLSDHHVLIGYFTKR